MMETRIVCQTYMPSFELISLDRFEIGYYTQKNPGHSGPNEDSLGIIADNRKVVLIVADGVGGSPKGEEASETAVEKVIRGVAKNFAVTRKGQKMRISILDNIESANETIIKSNTGALTTATICTIDHDFIRCFQIGDSSLLVCGQKGLLKYKALEQSPVGYALKAGFINEKQAFEHPERNLVLNLMGDRNMSVEIGPQLPFAQNDTVLIASDGIFDNFYSDELVEIIRKESMHEVMTKLTELCQPLRDSSITSKLRKPDDISFIVCRQSQP